VYGLIYKVWFEYWCHHYRPVTPVVDSTPPMKVWCSDLNGFICSEPTIWMISFALCNAWKKVANAALVLDPRKQQKSNVVPMSSGSYTNTAVLEYHQVTMLLSLKQHFYCSQCSSTNIAKQAQIKRKQTNAHNVNPFSPTCTTFLVELCNPITRQAIELESCSNPLRIQQVL